MGWVSRDPGRSGYIPTGARAERMRYLGVHSPPDPTPHPHVSWVMGPHAPRLINHEESTSRKELVGCRLGLVGGQQWCLCQRVWDAWPVVSCMHPWVPLPSPFALDSVPLLRCGYNVRAKRHLHHFHSCEAFDSHGHQRCCTPGGRQPALLVLRPPVGVVVLHLFKVVKHCQPHCEAWALRKPNHRGSS